MTFLIQQTLIYTIPLMIVALAGVFAERSGIINIALDGIMIFGSFMGALSVHFMQTNNILIDQPQVMFILAMLIAAISGALFSLLLSFSAINLKADPPTSWPRCPLRTRRPLKADPDPQGLLEKMGFQVGQAPSGSQEGQGRGVWRDPLAP